MSRRSLCQLILTVSVASYRSTVFSCYAISTAIPMIHSQTRCCLPPLIATIRLVSTFEIYIRIIVTVAQLKVPSINTTVGSDYRLLILSS